MAIWQLPAVDQAERPWAPPVPCPRCATRMLRYYRRERILACITCSRKAAVTDGQLSGDPILVWDDGVVQAAPALEPGELVT